MAKQYQHKRYYKQYNNTTSSYETFSSTDDAQTKLGFGSCFDTSSPTKTYSLEDSGQTLVVKYELNSDAEQTAFKDAIDNAWVAGTAFTSFTESLKVYHVKTEWLNSDDTVALLSDSCLVD